MQDQKTFQTLDLTEVTTPPQVLSLTASDADHLTVRQLSEYINTASFSNEKLAKYRTEWWYRVLYPFTLIILMFYGLLQGTRTDRRSALGGIMLAIVVLICFIGINQVFLAAGRNNRLPPFIAAIATEFIFGSIGLYLLSMRNTAGDGNCWNTASVGKPSGKLSGARRRNELPGGCPDLAENGLARKPRRPYRLPRSSVPAGYFKTPEVDTMNSYPHLLHAALAARFPHAVIT